MKSRRYLSYLLIILLLPLDGHSQNSLLTDEVTCRVGITSMNAVSFFEFNGSLYARREKKPHYQLQLGYKLNKVIDLGLYFGHSKLFHEIDLPYDAEKGYYVLESDDATKRIVQLSQHSCRYDSHAFAYGLKFDIHVLPILFNKCIDRLDVYLTPSIGLVSESYRDINDEIIKKSGFLSYGIGMGTNYYFTKHLGLFGEYHLGHFYNLSKSRWQAGIIYKF